MVYFQGPEYTFHTFKSNLLLHADVPNVADEQRIAAVEQTYDPLDRSPHQDNPCFKVPTAHPQERRIRMAIP